jgi:hypothetical protein
MPPEVNTPNEIPKSSVDPEAPTLRVKKKQDTTSKAELIGKTMSNQLEVKGAPLVLDEVGEFRASNQLPLSDLAVQETNKLRSRNPKNSPELAIVMDIDKNKTIPASMRSNTFEVFKKPALRRRGSTTAIHQRNTGRMMGAENKPEEIDMALTLKEIGEAKSEIDEAAEGLESLATRTNVRKQAVKGFQHRDVHNQATNSKNGEETDYTFEAHEGKDVFTPSNVILDSNPWKPGPLCEGSVLTYADSDEWIGSNKDPVTRFIRRPVGQEMNGSFKAYGVLMGVRFVVGI